MNERRLSEPRPVLTLVVLLIVPLLLGALLAPWVYALIQAAAGHGVLGGPFAHPKFKRVFSRTVMIVAIAIFYPLIKRSGMLNRSALGWPSEAPHPIRSVVTAYLIGAGSIGLIYALCTWGGALYWSPRKPEAMAFLVKAATLFVGSLLIGAIEETFCRGYIFGAFRKKGAFWPAAVAASLIFAGLHLFRPQAPEALDPTQWDAGLRLLGHLSDGVERRYLAPSMTVLFLMGLYLCRLRERFGNLYAAAGLHAGWVWAMGLGTFLVDRNGDRWGAWLGPSETIAMTWLGALTMLLFLVAPLPRRRP